MLIREATSGDWPGIWPFLQRIVRAGETYTWDSSITEDDARTQWLVPPPWRVFVAVDPDGAIVGTAKVGPNQAGPGAHVANASFMVDPTRAGEGIGRALGEHVLQFARDTGFSAMQFNAVVETNTNAVALWRSLGFDVLTTIPEAFRRPTGELVGLHLMYRQL